MISAAHPIKVLLIDSNVYFAKRLSDALKREGFEVTTSTQAAYALTALEYDAPGAILSATNMREMGALEIARIIRDRKSTRLNSSHVEISYAVFCLKKKKKAYKTR